jgi:hypothetical protein
LASKQRGSMKNKKLYENGIFDIGWPHYLVSNNRFLKIAAQTMLPEL